MLKYFLEEEQPETDHRVKQIIKKMKIKRRQYRGFHLDCPNTKKKLCYCSCHPIANLPKQNKMDLWNNYEQANNFYTKVEEKEVEEAGKMFEKCKQKIKALSCSELAEFVRTYRNEKNIHMGENGQYDAM